MADAQELEDKQRAEMEEERRKIMEAERLEQERKDREERQRAREGQNEQHLAIHKVSPRNNRAPDKLPCFVWCIYGILNEENCISSQLQSYCTSQIQKCLKIWFNSSNIC